MTNAFLKRATEYIRDDATLISIVSPRPLKTYYAKYADNNALLDLPVCVVGSPGSGKTTIGMVTEFKIMEKVLLDQVNEKSRVLADAYKDCHFIDSELRPRIAAVRLPMESEYRDFWELPYAPAIKNRLLLSAIQARAVQSLFRHLLANETRTLDDIRLVFREDADAALEGIGGAYSAAIQERAREIDRAIYGISASLVPPSQDNFPLLAQAPYRPFDVIRAVEIRWDPTDRIKLRPLIILDDAHTLHPDQFELLFRDLARREMKIGRWVLMRMDRLAPKAVLGIRDEIELPEIKRDRDFLEIRLQTFGQRKTDRKNFRAMASDMADRYLQQVRPIRDRSITEFKTLLSEAPPQLASSNMEKLKSALEEDRVKFGITHKRHQTIAELVERFSRVTKSPDMTEDVKLMMRRVLLHRYVVRIPQREFTFDESSDPEPRVPLHPTSTVADAARLYLHRNYERPLHYGFDTLCDASQENAELFLQLAGALVARSEARIIRGLGAALTPNQQQDELQKRAAEIIGGWGFPYARSVQLLVAGMVEQCMRASDKLNARLGGGPNAFGIPKAEITELIQGNSETARVLKFAFAYDAVNIVPDYGQGGKEWFLIELAGVVCLKHSLNLKRGFFLERRVQDLNSILAGGTNDTAKLG